MYRYLPLGALLSLLVLGGVKGFDLSLSLALVPVAFLAFKFDEKSDNAKIAELEKSIQELSGYIDNVESDLEEVRTHMSSIKLNQGMKRTF